MAKTFDEIVSIIKLGRPDWVNKAEKEHVRLEVHINGKHTAGYLTQIDSIENRQQLQLRKDFLTTNRHVFVNLSRPIDKVFSAKGGGNIYNLNTEAKEKQLKKTLSNIRHGKNIKTWIKDIQANKYYTDPSGLVFFEWDKNRTYPTIKSIKSIMNYETDGRTPEWVLFNPYRIENDEAEYYRFVDNEYDYTIKKIGERYTEIKDEKFKNPFGQCPAIVNSNIINSDLTHTESPFEIIISLADHYLRTGTIKNLNEFLHGYPIFWRYLSDCPVCSGSGYVEGKECKACGGKGINLKKDITDIINLSIPQDTDTKLAPDIAGYVTPDVVSWQEMRVEMDWLAGLMELTLWGSKMAKDANNETATAAFLNVQPVNDQLNNFADAYQDMEKKMTDLVGTFLFTKYDGSSINYGRRFLVEPPDVIWKKYETAKQSGSPKVSLNYLLEQFYQSEYANDIENLTIAIKGIKLEPFVHKTDEEISKLPIRKEDTIAKYYFSEWFKTIKEFELLTKPIEVLQKEFETYLSLIKIEENEIPRVQSEIPQRGDSEQSTD